MCREVDKSTSPAFCFHSWDSLLRYISKTHIIISPSVCLTAATSPIMWRSTPLRIVTRVCKGN